MQAKSEEWTTQTARNWNCETFWLQSFCTRNSSLANAKIYVLLHRFCFFILYLRAISKYRLSGAYIRGGNLTEDFFFLRYEFGGLKFGGAYFWIFRYFESFCSKVSGLKSKLGKVPLSVYTSVIKLSELKYTSGHTLTYCVYRPSSSS